ncbi:MAG TPA: Tn3 family transposase [Chloroflexota bacterium]|nr:Tn3 family transposase [Chloroflexota bacterium]HUM67233.1 Tn3 family transposase [Chloroflexota bacterium]
MPRRFLSQVERERLSQFPDEVTEADCIVYFTLTPADMELISSRRGGENRLGLALLLCSLRYLGYFPASINHTPENVVAFVSNQLQLSPIVLADYADRDETRREHLPVLMQHLDFRRVQPDDRESLIAWLGERVLEHDRPSTLLQQACERLYQLRLVRPAITTMEELVADARQWAEAKTIEVLVNPLSARVQKSLDTLLIPSEEHDKSPILWLRRFATGHSDKDILEALQKLAFIRQWAVTTWPVDELPPSRIRYLAQVSRYTSPQGLKRKKPVAKRYAILVAFLLWAHEKTIDELIELFDLCLADAYRRSKRDLQEFQLQFMVHMQAVIGYFRDMSQVVLDEAVADEAIRPTIYKQVPVDTLQIALDEVESFFIAGRKRTLLDFFDKRYSYFRRFTPAFLKALTFHNYADKESLLEALDVLREMNEADETLLPATFAEVPTEFVPAQWRSRVLNRDGTVNRRDYEMCALSDLRDSLRSGAVWLEGSRQYANLDSYLIPKARWEQLRQTYCEMVGIPADGAVQLELKQAALEENLARLDKGFAKNEFVRFENGELVLSPLDKEEEEIRQEHPLAKKTGPLLPAIQLGQLLAEVDAWTGFSQQLTHAGGATSRIPDLATHLYAAILTQACNMTLSGMADLSDLSYDQLLWCTNWYIREETLQAATDVLVNFQYQQPLSQYWGSGTFSSSDGQRFAVARKTNKASPLPRYFGFGRGLSVITWTSDQLSQYRVLVTPPRIRESTFTLDAILDNETVLKIKEHTTDTAGYTDMMFALFDLLGMQFSPRLRDIGDYTLYRLDTSIKYQNINPLLSKNPLKAALFVDDWDELLRVAASMMMGWVTASTFINKMLAYPRQHKLTQLLVEYGRLIRSTFIPFYLDDPTNRRRILVQLNKGEEVHGLRDFLFFDNKGQIRKQQPDDLANLAGCLNLLSNAVTVWNTVYMQAAIEELRRRGHTINEADFGNRSVVYVG